MGINLIEIRRPPIERCKKNEKKMKMDLQNNRPSGHDERAADGLVTDERAADGLKLDLIADVFRLQKIQGFVLGVSAL